MDMQKGEDSGTRTLNTRHILFIVSGAFDLLPEQVKKRIHTSSIGFSGEGGREKEEAAYLRLAETRDFIEYGFEPEFIGRIPVRVVCDTLSADDLEQAVRWHDRAAG